MVKIHLSRVTSHRIRYIKTKETSETFQQDRIVNERSYVVFDVHKLNNRLRGLSYNN